jgi:hypothetical protein
MINEIGTIPINMSRKWRQDKTTLRISINLKNFYWRIFLYDYLEWEDDLENESGWDEDTKEAVWFKKKVYSICERHIDKNPEQLLDSNLVEHLIYARIYNEVIDVPDEKESEYTDS